MADTKVTALADLPVPAGADLFMMVDDVAGTPTSKKATVTNVEAILTHDNLIAGTIASHDTSATGGELDTLTDGSDGSALHTHTLDTITDPVGDTAISMGSNNLKFQYSNPASDGFNIEAIGAFSGDLLHVHQHTGNPGAVNLVSMHAVDTDVTPLFIENAGGEIFKIDNSGNLTLDGTVDGRDIDTDGTNLDTHIADVTGDPHNIAADTLTFTNKTIDANGTGNSISNINIAEIESDSSLTKGSLGIVVDGAGSAVSTGVKGYLRIPYDCTIDSVDLVADQSGSIVVDIWKDTYANFPPTDADSITASAPPTLSTAQKSQDSTLTGWTTALSEGDYLGFNVDSASTITQLTLSLEVTKT